jgi:hypothetical protein
VSRLALTLLARPPRDERADGGVRVAAAATRGGTETPDRAPTAPAAAAPTAARAIPSLHPSGGEVPFTTSSSSAHDGDADKSGACERKRPGDDGLPIVYHPAYSKPVMPDGHRFPMPVFREIYRRLIKDGVAVPGKNLFQPARMPSLEELTAGARRGLRQQVHDGRHDRRGTTQDGPAVDRGTRRADAVRGERNGAHRGSGARVRLSGEHRGRDPPRAQVTRVGVLHLQRPRHHRQAGHRARRGGTGV